MRKSHKLDLAILSLVNAMPTYGHDLRAALPALGFPYYVHSAPVYDVLKRLEQDGLVVRRWEIQNAGPARVVYTITEAGIAYLQRVGIPAY
jgi:PadR family transcriptional regulator, regulatory protein PadR